MTNRWFLTDPPDDCDHVLLCFPYSGCGASMFRSWPDRVGDIALVPLHLPGRETRMGEPHYGTYERLAEQMTAELGPHLDRDFSVFGHCGGALAAFEFARRMASDAKAPTTCFISSQVAPDDGPYGRFLDMGTDELRVEVVRMLGLVKPAKRLVDFFVKVLVDDLAANRAYRLPRTPVDSFAIRAIGWSGDVEIPPGLMAGWAHWGRSTPVVLDGDHHAFIKAPGALLDAFQTGIRGG
ncbi:thioesterase domain-containing protein [Streptomyces sp. ID05-26A]|nr:thioesterase domain-containing protein [Streptomyces sp. ID05-26A]